MNTALRRGLLLSMGFLLLAGTAPLWAQPTLSKVFTPNTIGPGSVSTITFTITNGSASPVTGLAFTDVLPVAPGPMTIADPANASTTCNLGVSGSLTAPDGGGTVTLADAQIGGFSSCTVTVDVTASTPGMHTNPAVTLSSSAGSSMSLPIDLTVDTNLPGFSKSFAPSTVSVGERSTLTFTIDNSANASNVVNLDFVDDLPSGLVIADPAVASSTCGTAPIPPTVTAAPGTSQVALDADGTFAFPALAMGATCTVSLDVVAVGAGMLDNITGDLLASFVSAGRASATLEATITALAIRKEFTDDPVPPGGTATLEFVLTNFDRTLSATGVAFTDDLTTLVPPLAGLTYSSLLFNDCGGSVAGVGGTSINFSGGTLAPEAVCTIRVSLAVPAGATPGAYTNTSSTVTGTVGGSPAVGNTASDDLFVEPSPVLTKEFLEVGTLAPDPIINPGDSVVLRFTVTNTSTTSGATDITFLDELTDGGPGTGFLPFPVSVTLPPVPDPPCGAGSSLALVGVDTDRQGLQLTGGSLTAAPGAGATCTFDVTLTVPVTMGPGVYLNTTEEISATVDGATRLGEPASDDLTVIAAPQLTKEFTDDPVAPGGTVTLEFTLDYPAEAPGDATGITFTDDLAPVLAGLTANFPPTPDPPCGAGSTLTGSAGDTLLTLMGGSLMPGESCTFSVTLDVPAGAAPGTYANTTSGVGATVQGQPATSAPAIDDLAIAGLAFSKEFLGDPVIPGDTVTLRFTIDNIHPTADADIIQFTDNLGAGGGTLPGLAISGAPTVNTCGGTVSGTTSLTYNGGAGSPDVASGATCSIEVPLLVPGGAADGDYNNTTSVLIADQGGVVFIDPATDTLTVNSNLLQLSKAFTDDPVAPGDPVTLEFTLSNLDGTQAASAIAFTDDLGATLSGLVATGLPFAACGGTVGAIPDAGTIDFSGGSLGAGASCNFQVTLTVPGGAAAGVYPNTTSSVGGTIGGFAVTGDPGIDDLEVLQLLTFSKSFDGPTTATGTATLTFTITNPGTDTASAIAFSDDLNAVIPGLIATSLPAVPCGAGSSITGVSFLTFSAGELPPMGGMCSFDVEVLVPASATAGTYPNTTSDLFESGLTVAEPATADLVIEPPPTFAKVFAPDFIGLGQVSTLTFTIDNSASALGASALDFTDTLPAGVVVAPAPNASTTCTGGTITAVASSGSISYTGGSVAASASCTVQADVVGTAIGAHVNTTGDLTSSSGNSGTATDTLTVNPQPGFAKSFSPNPIAGGAVSTLTFVIDNTASTVAATGLDFTDNLPAGVTVATPANASTTCSGGVVTAVDGSGTISYTGGTVPAAATCTVQADTTASTAGDYLNTSGTLTSSLGASGTASDTLTVAGTPLFSKVFAPDSIGEGQVSTLTFTIDNSAEPLAATGLDFTDNLPGAVVVATPPNASTTCTGGTVTAVAGTGVISYSGGTVGAGATCTVSADVTSATAGSHVNTTGDLTSSLGNSGTATDTLTVSPAPGFSKLFAPNPIAAGGVSTLTFTVDNSAGAIAAAALDFTDNLPAGMTVATPPNPANSCGGTLTAVAGSGVISLTGGTVAAGATCTAAVDVTSATPGSHLNTSGDLTSSLGNSGPASDTLDVQTPPALTFSKSFLAAPILPGGLVDLEFTIAKPSPTFTATGITFTDDLDAVIPGLVAVGLPAADVCGGGSSVSGTNVITLTGGQVGPNSSCVFTVTVQVPATAVTGTYTNTTSDLTYSIGVAGQTAPAASADLEVDELEFTKEFQPNFLFGGASTSLVFEIINPDPVNAVSDLAFTDDLDAMISGAMATDLPQNDVCGFGSLADGTAVISLTGGSLPAGGSCSFAVTVSIPGTTPSGIYTNTTSPLASTVGGLPVTGDPADAASDDLEIQANVLEIPTLGEWMLLLLTLLLATAGWRHLGAARVPTPR